MKLLSTLSFVILLTAQLNAQSSNSEKELLKTYSETELIEIQSADAEKYGILVYALDHALEVVDFPKGKDSKVKGSIALSSDDLNFADLGLKIQNSNQYFEIEGTDKLLVVKSFFMLKNEMK